MTRSISLVGAATLSLSLSLALPAVAQETEAPAASAITLPLTARGNEPFWSVEATPDGLRLSEPEGKGTVQALPFTQSTDGGSLILTTTDFTLRIDPTLCRDDMSGMPYPFTATLSRASTGLNGCAGETDALLAGDWTVTAIEGTPVPTGVEVTMSFLEGRLIGASGCNRYIGSYALTGEGLTFGNAGATRMACPPPQMETEQALFTAFPRITRFDIAEDGTLLLQADEQTAVLTARR